MGEIMTTRHYLFGFSGRINRAKIWLWILIAIAAYVVMGLVVAYGFDWSATLAALKAHTAHTPVDWAKVPHPACKGTVSIAAMIVLALIVLAMIWAKFAVYIKRLHDRAKSAWWLVLYWAVPVALHGYACHAAGMPHHGGPHAMMQAMPIAGKAAYAVAMLIGLWVFIDLFLIGGTKGENKYGPDPRDPNWCDPDKPAKGCRPKPMKD